MIALNKMDEASERGIYVNAKELSALCPCRSCRWRRRVGQGIAELFRAAVQAVRATSVRRAAAEQAHRRRAGATFARCWAHPRYARLSRADDLLATQVAEGDPYFLDELREHFPS